MNQVGDKFLRIKKIEKFVSSITIISFVVLFGGAFGEAYAAIPTSERAALIALYNSTNGDNWSDNSGWKDPPLDGDGFSKSGTECNWHGVSCTGDNVTSLHLNSNQLTGNIPAELGDLTSLESFTLFQPTQRQHPG